MLETLSDDILTSILNLVTLGNRLKEGHVIDIAKASLEHPKYVLIHHFTRIGPDGIKQLGPINAEYTALVTNSLITILSGALHQNGYSKT